MADVFTVLAEDHEEVRALVAELEIGPARDTAVTQDQLMLRKKLAERLIIEASRHEALEEMYFWPAVREYHPSGDRLAEEATWPEQQAKEVLASLDKPDAAWPEFEQVLATFIWAARAHILFEETQVWPDVRAALPAALAAELGSKIAEGKKAAKRYDVEVSESDRPEPPKAASRGPAHRPARRRHQPGRADGGRGLRRPGRAAR